MAAQGVDRDYLTELHNGFYALFGDRYAGHDMHNDTHRYHPMGSMAATATYTLTVNININVSDLLKPDPSILNNDFNIGHYRPISRATQQEFSTGKLIIRLEYYTNNLDDFLKELQNKSWTQYDEQFTGQLETKLLED